MEGQKKRIKEERIELYDVSFVIPCYRSEKTISAVVEEIDETMKHRPALSYEIILVNDGSPDGVWEVIKDLSTGGGSKSPGTENTTEKRKAEAGKNRRITGICLAKNFGQHCALMAGFREASGDIIVSLDDDGQSPVDEVFQLIDKLNEGYDVVYATYPDYKQGFLRRLGSDFSQKMTNYMLNVRENLPKTSSFYVFKRFIRDEITRYDHPYPFMGGLILRATRNIAMVPLSQRERMSGKSGYTFKGLVSLWLNGFTAFSVKPLEFGVYIGFLFAGFGFLYAIVTIIRKLANPGLQAGWSSTMAALMMIGGILMLMLGMIGEYIGRIYICLNRSPQYVIRETTGDSCGSDPDKEAGKDCFGSDPDKEAEKDRFGSDPDKEAGKDCFRSDPDKEAGKDCFGSDSDRTMSEI